MSQGELQVSASIGNVAGQPEEGTLGPTAYATIGENGTVSLKATFDNKDRRLQPGQPVNVVLSLTTDPDAAVIPSSAVQTDEQGQYVFLVKPDQTVESRPVVVAVTVGDNTILTSGLEPGEIIVTDAGVPLRSGSRVNATGNDE
jgi:multidrug efflux system membrane fusion protein